MAYNCSSHVVEKLWDTSAESSTSPLFWLSCGLGCKTGIGIDGETYAMVDMMEGKVVGIWLDRMPTLLIGFVDVPEVGRVTCTSGVGSSGETT